MTVLTDRRADWDGILAPSRRFDKEGPGISSFPIVDTFEGEINDPQSLHKYLYGHADPVNNTDPTGQFSLGGFGGFALGLSIKIARISIAVGAGFSILNSISEISSLWSKNLEVGLGGFNVDVALPAMSQAVASDWAGLTNAQKNNLINRLHSLPSGLLEWDIAEMTFSQKSRWTKGLSGDVAEGTLTYQGHVFAIAEVNYVMWGLINRLAYDDGIARSNTNKNNTLDTVRVYRGAFGALLAGNEFYQGRWTAETTHGKVAFAEYGWHLVPGGAPRLPIEVSYRNAMPNNVAWNGTLHASAGGIL